MSTAPFPTNSPSRVPSNPSREEVLLGNRMDLMNFSEDQQDLIKRTVVQDTPIKVTTISYHQDTLRPILEHLPDRIRQVAERTHYRSNIFHFSADYKFPRFLKEPGVKQARKVGIDVGPLGFTGLPRVLKQFTNLEELTIGIDEAYWVHNTSRPKDGYPPQRLRPADIPFSMNLVILRMPEIQTLRNLCVPKVQFTPYVHGQKFSSYKRRTSGPIPGGVLETIVARDMMEKKEKREEKKEEVDTSESRKQNATEDSTKQTTPANGQSAKDAEKHAHDIRGCTAASQAQEPPSPQSSFRLLDLPGELRELVYEFVLSDQGPVNLTTEFPSSGYQGRKQLPPDQVRHSVLALLQTNKLIYSEAAGFFYADNQLVFYYPLQCISFLGGLGERRKSAIWDMSLWYTYTENSRNPGNLNIFDVLIQQVSHLRNLKRLELVVDETTAIYAVRHRIPGEERLRKMQERGVKVTFRCPDADMIFWHNFDQHGKPVKHPEAYGRHSINRAKQMKIGVEALEKRVGNTKSSA